MLSGIVAYGMASTVQDRSAEERPNSDAGGRRRPRWGIAFAIALGVVAITTITILATSPQPVQNPACDGDAPCAVLFSWGMPFNESGTTPVGCPSSQNHYCYSIELAGNVSIDSVTLSLRSAVGATIGWPTPAADLLSLVSPGGAIIATYGTINSTWTLRSDSATFGEGNMLVIYTPLVGVRYGLQGDSIMATIALGGGSTASTPSSAFP